MCQNPTEFFNLSDENGVLRLRPSKAGRQHHLVRLLWIVLIVLFALGASVSILGPLTPPIRFLLIVAALGTLGPALASWLIMQKEDVLFDRLMDRLLIRGKIIGRLSDITGVILHRQGQLRRPRNQLNHALSIIFKTGERYIVATLTPPATELSSLAATIGRYLGVPISPLEESENYHTNLRRQFQGWEWGSYLLFLTLWPLTGFIWWAGFQLFGSWTIKRFADAAFVLGPTPITWLIPAMIMGLVSAVFLIDLLYRGLLKTRYDSWVDYQASSYGYHWLKASKCVYIVVITTAMVYVGLFADWYTVFSKNLITINRLLSLSEAKYPYEHIREIKTAQRFLGPDGKAVERREYVIRFSDGEIWSTYRGPSDLTDNGKRELIRFVEAQSEVSAKEVKLLQYDEIN